MESYSKKENLLADDPHSSKETVPESSSNGESRKYLKYKKRPGTVDKGKEYEILMCALYALKFGTSENVCDFKMSTNDETCGDFDDIKLDVTYKNGEKRLYLFQLKHKQNETYITNKTLSAKSTQKNAFGLIKYLKEISNQNGNREAIFILYTNRPTKIKNGNELLLESQDSLTVIDGSNMEYKDLLATERTSETPCSIFQFELRENKSNLNKDALKRFYLFANQKNVDQVKSLLKTVVKELLMCDISGSYIQFIQDWYLGNSVLTIHALISKLTELALSPFIKIVSGKKYNEKSKQLGEALMEFEMTLIRSCEEEIVENIWKAAEEYKCSMSDLKKFRLTNDPVDVQTTKVLWYLDMIPLFVEVHDTNKMTVLTVIKLLKRSLKYKNIVLLGNITKTDFPHNWTIFENLSDLVDNLKNKQFCRNILHNFNVSFQGRQQISLKTLIEFNDEMATIIGTKELLKMSQANFLQIGNSKMELPASYISRTVSSFSLDVTKTLHHSIQMKNYIIIINCSENCRTKIDLKRLTIMELSQYLEEENKPIPTNLVLLTTQYNCTSSQFDQVCNKSIAPNVYLFQILDNKCTLLLRKGSQLPLDSIKTEAKPVEENEIFRYLNKPLNVVCASPGMGKSMLFRNLHNTCPAEYWCIYVNLISLNGFLKTNPDHSQFWKHLLEFPENKQDSLVAKTVHVFLKSKKIQLFLDGLDEVDSKYIDVLLTFIKYISSEKANVWLSSRENVREIILSNLNIVPIEIQELNQKQQKKYVCDRLQNIYSHEEKEAIVEAIFNSADVTNSQQMLGIPLQLYIITENFLNNVKCTCVYEQNNFVLTAMYKQFFDGKKKFAHKKLGIEEKEHQLGIDFNDILRKYELPALQVCLDKADFDKLNLDPNDNAIFIERIKSQGDKFGIIKQITEDRQIIFEHQTYAEYFACVWLKTHLTKARLLREELFLEKYENLKIIFDIMLGEQSPLHLAVIYKNIEEIERNLAYHDVKDQAGRKALHLACSYGMKYSREISFDSVYYAYFISQNQEFEPYVTTIEMLLSKCENTLDCKDLFDFNYVDYSLLAQCLYPIEKMLEKRLLTSEECKLFFKYYKGEELVYHACLYGYPQILSHILTLNSRILEPYKSFRISLLDVVIIGSSEDSTRSRKQKQTHAAESCYAEVINLLFNYGINMNKLDEDGKTPLQFACEKGNYSIVKKLLEKGADINALDSINRNALHYAFLSRPRNIELIELLINHGISTNVPDECGKVALHTTCEESHVGVVKKLLKMGTDINALDMDNKNALHYALQAFPVNIELIKLLINHDINVNARDKSGRAVLHTACEQGNVGILTKLLEKGADVNILDNSGMNAMHYVFQVKIENTELIEILINHGINVNVQDKSGKTALHLACEKQDVDVVKLLINCGSDVNARSGHKSTPFLLACQFGPVETVQTLISSGADILAVDNDTDNGLHCASLSDVQSTEKVNLLLNLGLDVNAQNKGGQTALHYACQDNLNVAKILVRNNADVTIIDKNKCEALDYARKWNNLEIVNLLKKQ